MRACVRDDLQSCDIQDGCMALANQKTDPLCTWAAGVNHSTITTFQDALDGTWPDVVFEVDHCGASWSMLVVSSRRRCSALLALLFTVPTLTPRSRAVLASSRSRKYRSTITAR